MDTINALGGMLQIPQWFVWRLTWDAEENKFQKVPCYPDGSKYRMDASDPVNWRTFDEARSILATLRTRNDGFAYTLGFWLSANTGYWFFDIDKCVTDGKLSPLAQQFAGGFNGAAWEWSSSGRGLHIFGRGTVPAHRRKDIHRSDLEFYTDGRGIAFGLSGQFFGNADLDFTPQVEWLVANYFPHQALPGEVLDSEFDRPASSWVGPLDDGELIARMRRAQRLDAAAVFSGTAASHATFSDLFDGNMSVLQRIYPGQSDMDYALIGILSFWTGRDALRTERIMRRSALYRDKWESYRGKDTYLRYSILRQFRIAHAEGRPVYGARRDVAETPLLDGNIVSIRGLVSGAATDVSVHDGVGRDAAISGGHAGGGVQTGHGSTTETPLVTITVAPDPSRHACFDQHRAAFFAAANAEELETAAMIARADPRMTDDLAYSLASELHIRFEQIQVKKRIQWCRAVLQPERAPSATAVAHRDCTEFGNVDRMMDAYGANLMYVDETEQWYRWDERRWLRASPGEVYYLAQQAVHAIHDEARSEENEETRARLMQWAMDSQKARMVDAIVRLAKSDPRVFARASVLDANVQLLGAQNGLIDLRTGALLPPDRNARVTQCVSVDYDPGADCPWFKRTVREAFFDDMETILFFKRLMGYTLLGSPSEQKLVIPYGHGSNGKSTIINAIGRVLGDYCANASSETFMSLEGSRGASAGGPREDLVRLRGARLLTISEVEESAQLRENIVKSLTGDDPITARGVNARASITYRPRFVPLMSTNHIPIVKGDDNGIWRRILLLPFERNFERDPLVEKDPQRSEKIMAESMGVLAWLVQGALEYQSFGLSIPMRVRLASEEYREDMDILREWINERVVFDPDSNVSSADLFLSWQQYAQPRGLFRMIGSQNALSRKLKGRNGFVKGNNVAGKQGRCWRGIRLKSAAEVTFNG